MKKILFTTVTLVIFMVGQFSTVQAQTTTVQLAQQCDCEVKRPGTEITAGATTPAGLNVGDLLIDASGDVFYWDGDSWEPSTASGSTPWNNPDGTPATRSSTDINYTAGNVGIGLSNPTQAFEVNGLIQTGRTETLGLSAAIKLKGTNSNATNPNSEWGIWGMNEYSGRTNRTFEIWNYNNAGTGTSTFTITEDNKIGFLKSNPSERLDVNGRMQLGETSSDGLNSLIRLKGTNPSATNPNSEWGIWGMNEYSGRTNRTLEIWNYNNNIGEPAFVISEDNAITLPQYTGNNHEDTNAVKILGLDATGKIVTLEPNAVGGSMSGVTSYLNTQIAVSGSNVNRYYTVTYTPLNANSTIYIDYDMNYSINGWRSDVWGGQIIVNGSAVMTKYQRWYEAHNREGGAGSRSTVAIPIQGRYDNTDTSTKTIQIRLFRAGGDDFISGEGDKFLRIIEVKN